MKKTTLSVLFILTGLLSQAQTKQLSGSVTDTLGNALEGVSVISTDTHAGTKTDKNGFYSFAFPAGTRTLSFSFVGHQTLVRTVENTGITDVQLKLQPNKLDEVVMIATSLQKTRQNLGYSVGVLGNEELTIAEHPILQMPCQRKYPACG